MECGQQEKPHRQSVQQILFPLLQLHSSLGRTGKLCIWYTIINFNVIIWIICLYLEAVEFELRDGMKSKFSDIKSNDTVCSRCTYNDIYKSTFL